MRTHARARTHRSSSMHAHSNAHVVGHACTCHTMQVRNPANGQVLATLPLMRGNETKAAIAAADSVFPQWKRTTAKERCAVLRRWGESWHGQLLAAPVCCSSLLQRAGSCEIVCGMLFCCALLPSASSGCKWPATSAPHFETLHLLHGRSSQLTALTPTGWL